MSGAELALHFPSSTEVNVSFDGTDSGKLNFANPVTEQDRAEIRWYVETYGAMSLADPDDQEARRIKARLPEIGKALFQSVFDHRAAQRLFNRFKDADNRQRVLTISSQDASILAIPWELLHDPSGTFLFREKPHISVRRGISGATSGREPFRVEPKDRLHLLFVDSRPTDAGFIDPRADPQAVLDALEKHVPGRVTWEFLRPATLNALVERLDDDTKPAVDILHFDGHGVFKQVSEEDAERHPGLYGKSILSEIQRERLVRGDRTAGKRVGIGFLVFEKEDGRQHLIPAEDLADNLYRSRVGLVVLSACQTAALDAEGDPMASVAGRLTTTGIPAILAMTHAVLVPTTRMLFGKFYESLARGRGIATALDDARTYLANNPEKYEVRRGDRRQMLELDDWFLPALFHGGADSPLLTSRTPDFGHPDYRIEGTRIHRRIVLEGLASLELSLDHLTEPERHAVRRLGVFQGGAFEDDLLAITQLGERDDREQLQALLAALDSGDLRVVLRWMGIELPDDAEIPAERLAQLWENPELAKLVERLRAELAAMNESGAENVWPGLCRQLESAALIEVEYIPGVAQPFLRFHPTLAPMLWAGLEADECAALTTAHRRRYFALARYLYLDDHNNPHRVRAIARRELPNLLHAVDRALEADDADVAAFVECVNKFLKDFGMTREAARLTRRAGQAGGQRGSQAWYLRQTNRGEQLLASGRAGEAAKIFADILETFGDQRCYPRAATLNRLSRCYAAGGRPDLADATSRQGIAIMERLEPSDWVNRPRAGT